jgi:2-hydroxychromene-2-carboxylate isomerase
MIITKRLKGKAIAAWLGPAGDRARKAIEAVRERVTSTPRRLDVYFDIADPWSYLTAQAVSRLISAYPVELGFHVVTPPASDVDPAPTLRASHAVRDAQQLADYWDIDFPGKKAADSGLVRDLGSALIRDRPAADQLRCALELARGMWANDRKAVTAALGTWGTEAHIAVAPILNESYQALRKAGHYQGAMIRYKDTWYWGLDRLPYLEAELAKDTGVSAPPVLARRGKPDERRARSAAAGGAEEIDRDALALSDKPLVCEMWFSFRSPYSYLALEQIEAVLAPYQLPLVLRPIAPMVTRGLAVPTVKRMYIVRDAKREADRLGIPFGELCDPLGTGIDHCLAVAHRADALGKSLAFARSAMRGIWSEARDMAEYVDLRHVVERAGIAWEDVKDGIGDPAAGKWATAGAADLAVIGLWGVPSFRVGDFVAWGQDRLPLLAERLRRHFLMRSTG